MAFIIPFLQPAATAAATYFGITGTASAVTGAVTASITPGLTIAATKIAESAALYALSKMADWSCTDAATFLEAHCARHSWTDVGCIAMKGKYATSCVGTWVLSGAAVYDGVDFLYKMKKEG